MEYNFAVGSEGARRFCVDRRANPSCPFNRVVGQEQAVDLVADLCYQALGRRDHFVPASLIFAGPASVGKTHLATVMADALNIIRVITDATQLRNNDSLAHLILEAWAKEGLSTLQPAERYGETSLYVPDTTLIFIDEIHALTQTAQDGLLKATERNDGMLFAKNTVLNLRKAIWIGATTDWGKLCAPFRTRFTRVQLYPYTFEQVVEIVHRRLGWEDRVCREVVKYGGLVPREVLQFAWLVDGAAKRMGVGVGEVLVEVARREGIDEYGMRVQRLGVLVALGGHGEGMLLRHLVGATGLQQDELLQYWLPPLLNAAPGEESLVRFDGRYYLTERGKEELRKRKRL
jgi:replication-associated recombination protein RarA